MTRDEKRTTLLACGHIHLISQKKVFYRPFFFFAKISSVRLDLSPLTKKGNNCEEKLTRAMTIDPGSGTAPWAL